MKIRISGEAYDFSGSKSGFYMMQPDISNRQRYWMSPEGNAIWYGGGNWFIGDSEDLGTAITSPRTSLFVPIKDPSKECPHNVQSNWKYGTNGNGFVEDVANSVSIECVKGKFLEFKKKS